MEREANHLEVSFISGESYEIAVRGHRIVVDQPAAAGGDDAAPTPTELLIASLASCVAFYAGRYLTRHGFDRTGMSVSADFDMADDRPARVSTIRINIKVPTDLPDQRRAAFLAVASACTVHNTLHHEPEIAVDLT